VRSLPGRRPSGNLSNDRWKCGHPYGLNDLAESDPHELYPHLLRALAPNLAYLPMGHGGEEELLFTLRKLCRRP
jgi:hypothetical protein